MNDYESGLLRTLAFHDAWGYPPTFYEWLSQAELPDSADLTRAEEAADALTARGLVVQKHGRVVFPERAYLIREHEIKRRLFHRKVRKVCRTAKWLARLPGVKFVALCNATALGNARPASDLDFFVVTEPGHIWQTRFASVLPFKIANRRPKPGTESPDAVCLSFFMDATSLSLESLQIKQGNEPDDPYLRYWFLSLLPVFDDGVSERLWKENTWATKRHPLAEKWIPHPDLLVHRPRLRLPAARALERTTKALQRHAFPATIKERANKDTDVVVSDRMLKFHTRDRRAFFRKRYELNCRTHRIPRS